MDERDRPILLVEDSQDDAELAILALREAGVVSRVDVVRDGEEALEYLFDAPSRSASPPLLVLLDIKLPKIDGFAVLRRIRQEERTRMLPTVILSSSTVREDIARAYELGANSYVRKPVEFSGYSDKIRQVGLYWVNLNEPAH
jgi:two-component system response regulator